MRFNTGKVNESSLLTQEQVAQQLLEEKKIKEARAKKFGTVSMSEIDDQRKIRAERFKSENQVV